uniref:Structural maintenance of chromosomes protein n=1 Tax=Chromera velia CCMP2878 TaxID=1169474 RepID=A0A0G4IBW9_9ALVE|eukprot:Cvel_12928.t1-p1 / transcript=Cvel_12928.t1 / gene=Cvel_12928 / organism=Chromera_velia_CCMP2878 / gene_product=Structural maintenance of chromosomes protein 3, putative / transcript_product=Structural maintenance of chromosomes protein 3, putative / location=Cvel_scaffold864:36755-49908(-) / protein_length=1296 / sequence_SO=supercontig / SO=protein_coding / is_pseudo=false
MHIKILRIRGYKTYRDPVEIHFNENYNAIVGLNGAGKSNLLSAIEFVLPEMYSAAGRQHTRELLHEGINQSQSAFVEVVFDNTDRKLPYQKDEVSIRRQFANKKDEWLVDGKHVTKRELDEILESAGFGRSGAQSSIVRQGRIAEFALMGDAKRLDLLKEVAGTRQYDDKRREAEKVMLETAGRRAQATETLDAIAEKVKTLAAENEELRKCAELERRKKILEWSLNEKEWKDAQSKLESLLGEKEEVEESVAELKATVDRKLAAIEKQATEVKNMEERLADEKSKQRMTQKDLSDARNEKYKTELELDAQKKSVTGMREDMELAKREKEDLERDIARLEGELKEGAGGANGGAAAAAAAAGSSTSELSALREEVEEKKRELEEAQLKHQLLKAKQGRKKQYNSVQERNKALDAQEKELLKIKEQSQKNVAKLRKDAGILRARGQQSGEGSLVQKLMDKDTKLQKKLADETAVLNDLDLKKTQATGRSQEVNGQLDEVQRELTQVNHKLRDVQYQKGGLMNVKQRRGLEVAREFAKDRARSNEGDALGTLVELIDVRREAEIAAEAIGGNELWNFVVKDDEIGTRLIRDVRLRDSVFLNVCPLNQVTKRLKRWRYPTGEGNVTPLVDMISCSDEVRPAVVQTFGKALLVDNDDTALRLMRKEGWEFDLVTPQGTIYRVDRAIKGGSTDKLKRIELTKREKDLLIRQGHLQRRRDELQSERETVEEALRRLHQDRTQVGRRIDLLDNERKQTLDEVRQANMDFERDQLEVKNKEESAKEFEDSIRNADMKLQFLRSERLNNTLGNLTEGDMEQLAECIETEKKLGPEVVRLEEELRELKMDTEEKEATLKRKQQDVRDRGAELLKLQMELDREQRELQLRENERTEAKEKFEKATGAFDEISKVVEGLEEKLEGRKRGAQGGRGGAGAAASSSSSSGDRKGLRAHLSSLRESLSADEERASREQSRAETLMEKIAEQQRLVQEKNARVASHPPVAVGGGGGRRSGEAEENQFEGKSRQWLSNELQKTNHKLKKFNNVNRKATHQVSEYEAKEAQMRTKKGELDESDEKIKELIKRTDAEKASTLKAAFDAVGKHFAEVFGEMQQGGKAKLELIKMTDAEMEKARTSTQELVPAAAASSLALLPSEAESFKGVGVHVSFSGKSQSFLPMNLLSGGQKTLVALSLIFAIQRYDPAPFYLLDEVDAALDNQYRAAVAETISRQTPKGRGGSGPGAQFILTTFRAELLEPSDIRLGVTIREKVSRVKPIGLEEAKAIIMENEQREREKEQKESKNRGGGAN